LLSYYQNGDKVMVDDLIAIAALADIALTAFLMIRFRRKPFSWLHVLVGLVTAVIVGSIFFPVYYSTGHGAPLNLLVITYCCFGAAMLFPLAKRTWNLVLFCVTLAMALVLPWFAVRLPGYTFTSHPYTRLRGSLSHYLDGVPHQELSYPAGWLADEPFALDIPRSLMTGRVSIAHPLWHSRFSGIYRLEIIKGEAWYLGGKLVNGRWKIEIRTR